MKHLEIDFMSHMHNEIVILIAANIFTHWQMRTDFMSLGKMNLKRKGRKGRTTTTTKEKKKGVKAQAERRGEYISKLKMRMKMKEKEKRVKL